MNGSYDSKSTRIMERSIAAANEFECHHKGYRRSDMMARALLFTSAAIATVEGQSTAPTPTPTFSQTANGPTSVSRQLVGQYIRIGLNRVGTLGSGGNIAPGMQYDATGLGNFTDNRDYLTPGLPYEAFTVRWQNLTSGVMEMYINNNYAIDSSVVVGTLSIASGETRFGKLYEQRAMWSGQKAGVLRVEHDVGFNVSSQYIDIVTRVTNIAAEPLPSLYFGRFMDPDIAIIAGDEPATWNSLGFYSIPTSNAVFAEALASRYTLALVSAATNCGAGITQPWSKDPKDYYDGRSAGELSLS